MRLKPNIRPASRLICSFFNHATKPLLIEDPVQTFCNLAIARFTVGDAAAANEILAQLHQEVKEDDDRKNQPGRLAKIAIAYSQISGLNAAIAMLDEIKVPQHRIELLWVVAHTQFKQKQLQAVQQSLQLATKAYQEIQDKNQRAKVVGILARIQALAGEHGQTICCVENALAQTAKLLPALVDIFIDTGEIECFRQLIIPCSYHLESAYEISHSLAQLYPEYSGAIAAIVQQKEHELSSFLSSMV